jgi:predicted Zn finger-like uncharacterized protein
MSLATRCTACGTVFRVVQDQLKVSEGWVRCGRCGDVFNALEGLFDLDRDAPLLGSESGPLVAGATRGTASEDGSSAATAPPKVPSAGVKIDAQLAGARDGEHGAAPAVPERDRLEFPDAQFGPDVGEEEMAMPSPLAAPTGEDVEPITSDAAPEFLQRAQRQARWQSPRMRVLQAASVVLLIALLGLQATHHLRDIVAARWPATAAPLAAWCGVVGCGIEAPRRIEDVAVESTALTRVVPGQDAFKLSVVLRNRGTTPVTQPSIDLSLTDVGGQVIARRMLSARDFRVASASIKPGAETTLQLVLSAGAARVSGYTVEIFYP